MEPLKDTKKATTRKAKSTAKSASKQPEKKEEAKKAAPTQKTEVESPTPAPKVTDWEQVRRQLRASDGSLSLAELDTLVSILSAPRRKRGISPNGWLTESIKSLLA